MKFLCPSCKAKYQIADEKITGRTVRMKCRQCGNLIEINEAVIASATIPSVVPPPKVQHRTAEPAVLAPDEAPPHRAPGTSMLRDAPPKPPGSKEHAPLTRVGGHGALPPRASAARDALANRAPAPLHPPRGSTANAPTTSLGPRPAPARGAAAAAKGIALRVDDPFTPSGTSLLAAEPKKAPPAGAPHQPKASSAVVPEVDASPKKEAGTLASAFTAAVQAAPSALDEQPLAPDEWYVGIGQVPIGPIRLGEIRDRAVRGEITAESLVWRDGFEDWKPLGTFPELLAVVEEGLAATATVARIVAASPVAAAPPSQTSTAVSQPKPMPPPAAPAPVAAGPVASVATAASTEPTSLELEELAGLSRRRTPKAAWIAVGGALVLGLALGMVVLQPEPAAPIIKYVPVPAQSGANDNSPSNAASRADNSGDSVATQEQSSSDGKGSTKKSSVSTAQPSPSSSSLTSGLKGLSGLRGATGPQSGPSGQSQSTGSSGQPLDSATLSRTVSHYTASVRRSCWQPALDTRDANAPTTARVSVSINIAPNGRVQSATTSGDPKGYRGLSACIQNRVKNWEFPASSGPTTVNVPFVFAAQ